MDESDFVNLSDVVDTNALKTILERGVLSIDDDICFHTTVDVLNGLFGKKYEQGFAASGESVFWDRSDKKYIWFTNLNSIDGGCENTLHDDALGQRIHQRNLDPDWLPPMDERGIERGVNEDRAVFARYPGDEYRFIGVFKLYFFEDKTAIIFREATEINLGEWNI